MLVALYCLVHDGEGDNDDYCIRRILCIKMESTQIVVMVVFVIVKSYLEQD